MSKLKIISLAFALALMMVSISSCAQPSTAQPTASPSTSSSAAPSSTSPLVGSWRMTSLEMGAAGKLQPVPYSGQIIFTESGGVSVQAMNPDANAADTLYTRTGYEAYYGTYTVDETARTFTMTIRSSLVRDLIGQRLTRAFKVSGGTLVLTPTDASEGWRVTYERF
ncbi:Lipocalin-like domain-containing protein [Streptosporangium canum]|uniref:Lipocalin-like domain-containing protein n=1 Tax=Streptosporangium canum TaxID=324952 RepID=A0A1I3HAR4_9ACTN|nr:lipocalin-like domain-containing protein [Streptosporangium canum]SFI32709.1 Lipocalin-like domain-containing protein [Streptosporangium canum]